MTEVAARRPTVWSRAQDSWHHTRPAVRVLWMFLLAPGILLGLLALLVPTMARTATTVVSPMLIIAAGVWISRHEDVAAQSGRRSRRQRTMLLILIGSFIVALLLAKLYS
jgi:hypothetical protein